MQEALNRVLAEDLFAQEALPRFDKSAMDGYAVRSADLVGASQSKPVVLQVNSRLTKWTLSRLSRFGQETQFPKAQTPLLCLRTPRSAVENLEVWSQLAPWTNVSKIGEDIKKGDLVVKAGTRLNPYHIGLAAALGYSKLKVVEKPKIAIIATGNEIAEVGTERASNQIYDSNKTMISAMCHELGAETTDFGIAKDNIEEIAEKIQKALKTHDAIITTGGTSVGGLDLVPDAVNKLGKPGVIVHGVALRPAMPTAVGMLEGKPVLILSGNPVAAVIGFEVFGRPLICKTAWAWTNRRSRPIVKAILARRITSALGRKTYVRVRVT